MAPDYILVVFNEVRLNKGLLPLAELSFSQRLDSDLSFDSLDLAELTVRLEDRFGVDVFEFGLLLTVGDICAYVESRRRV
jgi:acyl carrier protein